MLRHLMVKLGLTTPPSYMQGFVLSLCGKTWQLAGQTVCLWYEGFRHFDTRVVCLALEL